MSDWNEFDQFFNEWNKGKYKLNKINEPNIQKHSKKVSMRDHVGQIQTNLKHKPQQKIMIRRDKIDILTSVKNGKNDVALFITSVLYYFIIWAILVCSIKSSPLMGIYFILSVLVSWFIVTEHLRVFAYFIDFTLITLWVLLWGGPYTVMWMVVLSGFEVVRMRILECDQNEMQTM